MGAAAGQRVPYAVAARELLRTTLLDAAHHLLQERPWSAVTMAQVATAAGVSRQTLYKEFGSREEFAQALVLREADRFLGAVEDAVRSRTDRPAAALEAALELFLTSAAQDPVVRAIVLEAGEDSLLPLVTTQGQPLVEGAVARLTEVIVDLWPASREDAALLAETLVRLGISYAALPGGPPADTAAETTRLLAPFIERALAG